MITNQLKNQHLAWRAAFGPIAEEFSQLASISPKTYLNALFKASSKSPGSIDVADNAIKGLVMGVDNIARQQKNLSEEQKKKLRQQSREDLKNLNLTWLNEMVVSEQQLREKMALFWHGHFASRNINILYQQQLLDVVRKNALGSFRDLLVGVSKSAAMINFLNNNQNRKGHPNENFAREVMELFTLGRGHYSEQDIKEAARAFTGWGANMQGDFVFRKFQHDDGKKAVLGHYGNLTGDDVLEILLQQKQTSNFITRKIYRHFVNEKENPQHIHWLSERFFQSGYNIANLMRDIFSSEWFYDLENIGNKIKSPIELLVGIQRAIPMKIKNEEVLLVMQRLLGQLLFYPPNVAGWPGGKNWIDSSSLMLRLRIPQILLASDSLSATPKDDDDQMMGRTDASKKNVISRLVETEVDWKMYIKQFETVDRKNLAAAIEAFHIQGKLTADATTLQKFIDASGRENFIRSATIRLMSLPEYQLC